MKRATTIAALLRARAPLCKSKRGDREWVRYSACSPSLKAQSVMRFSSSA